MLKTMWSDLQDVPLVNVLRRLAHEYMPSFLAARAVCKRWRNFSVAPVLNHIWYQMLEVQSEQVRVHAPDVAQLTCCTLDNAAAPCVRAHSGTSGKHDVNNALTCYLVNGKCEEDLHCHLVSQVMFPTSAVRLMTALFRFPWCRTRITLVGASA